MIKKYSFFTGWWHLLLQQHIYPYSTAYTCQTEILVFNTRPRINNILKSKGEMWGKRKDQALIAIYDQEVQFFHWVVAFVITTTYLSLLYGLYVPD
ncbi:hypothetical protein Bca101_073432 [Brassica carinata]